MESRDEEKSRGFKVDDRRRFSETGDLKPEHSGADPAPQPASTPPPASAAHTAPTIEPADAHQQERPSAEITFAGFVVSLSTQALVHLGEIPDPASARAERDLPAAQQIIDILGVLRDKTRGNLDADEDGLLESMLYDLRMKYVELTRQIK